MYKNIKELQEAIDALPLVRSAVDGLDPSKTVVACYAGHLEEAIAFYKEKLNSLPAFYVYGDYSNIKVDKNISLNDFEKLDNSFSVQIFTRQNIDPWVSYFNTLSIFLHKQGNRDFSIEYYSTEKLYDRQKKHTFDDTQWQSILEITNRLKDADSKYAYMGTIKSLIHAEPGYIPYANYRQYFHPNVQVEPHDIVVDGGIDDGVSTIKFYNAMQNKGKIYAFEAFEPNWQRLREKFAPLNGGIILEEKALWDKTGFINIAGDLSYNAHVSTDINAKQTPCITIDDYFKDKEISCIKLDVEGAELNVLKGAENTIAKNNPKLLLSIYHAHHILVPKMVMDMNLDYDFYCGHHTSWFAETILYGIKK